MVGRDPGTVGASDGTQGYHTKYGGMQKYLAWCAQPGNASEHGKFLKSLSKFVAKHTENPSTVRLRARSELVAAQTVLDTEMRSGSKRTKRMVFVNVDNWDVESYGPLPTDKITEQVLDGVVVRGVWRDKGQEGHYDFEFYEDSAVRERTREADGRGPFAAEQLANARETVLGALRSTQQQREANAVQAPDMSISKLVALVERLPGTTLWASSKAGSDDGDDEEKAREGDNDDDDDDADEEKGDSTIEISDSDRDSDTEIGGGARDRLLGLFRGGDACDKE